MRLNLIALLFAVSPAWATVQFDFQNTSDGWSATSTCAQITPGETGLGVITTCVGGFESPSFQLLAADSGFLELTVSGGIGASGLLDVSFEANGQSHTLPGAVRLRGDLIPRTIVVALQASGAWAGTVTRIGLRTQSASPTTFTIHRAALVRAPWRGAWTFERDGDLEGWTATSTVVDLGVAASQLSGSVALTAATKPRLQSPRGRRFRARAYRSLFVTLKASSPTPGQELRVWWGTKDTPTLNVSRSQTVAYSADSTEQTVRFDLFESAKWRGGIETLWVQPFLNPEEGAQFHIQSVAFGPRFDFSESGDQSGFESALPGFRVSDGALRATLTQDTPTVVSAPISSPLGPFERVLIEAQLDEGGPCTLGMAVQTDAGAIVEMPLAPTCDGKRHAYIVPTEGLAGWSGEASSITLTLPAASAARDVAISRIEFLAPGPSVELLSIRPQMPAFVGSVLKVDIHVRNLGGDASTGGKVIVGGPFVIVPPLAPNAEFFGEVDVAAATSCDQPGKTALAVNAQLPGNGGLYTAASSLPITWLEPLAELPPEVPPAGSAPLALVVPNQYILMQNSRIRAALHYDSCLGGYGYLRLFAAKDGVFRPVGGRIGLGRLSVGPPEGTVETLALAGPMPGDTESLPSGVALPLTQTLTDSQGTNWTVSWNLTMDTKSASLTIATQAVPDQSAGVFGLTTASLEIGLQTTSGSADGGYLGGLEFFGADLSGASGSIIAGPDANPQVPEVALVTRSQVSATSSGLTGGLHWDPAQTWAGPFQIPSVHFEAPRGEYERETALFELLVPNTQTLMVPGDSLAAAPMMINAFEPIQLSGTLVVARSADAAALFEPNAVPEKALPSPPTLSLVEARAQVKAALTETGWNGGWVLSSDQSASPAPEVLAVARRLAQLDGDSALAGRADAVRGTLTVGDWLNAGPHDWNGWEATWLEGPTAAALAAGADALLSDAQALPAAPDYLLMNTPQSHARLAWRLLRFARLTGLKTAEVAGLALLNAEDLAGLPRGGATAAGIPTDAPDVITPIDRAMACAEAARLTGQDSWAEAARHQLYLAWAFMRTDMLPGAPPDRDRYGVQLSFGAREFTESLQGRYSTAQGARLGLATRAVASLGAMDPLTAELTEKGTVLVAALGMAPLGTGEAGLIRAEWDARSLAEMGPWELPWIVARGLLNLSGTPLEMTSQRVETPAGLTVTVASAATMSMATFDLQEWRVKAAVEPLLASHTVTVTFGGLSGPPPAITVSGVAIPEVDGLAPDATGWRFDASIGLAAVRVANTTGPITVALAFPVPDVDQDTFPANTDCDDNDPAVHPGAEELCNGVDDDCNDQTDEPEATGWLACGLGQCAHQEPACVGGQEATCDPLAGASGEVCDSVDNDCDGLTDEDEDVGTQTCGVGQCEHSVFACSVCDPLEGADTEICDGIDNDCDGETDETPGTVICGQGQCEHVVSVCELESCDPFAGASEEVCDLIDNNCDGQTDEGLPTVPCGIGECTHQIPACAPCVEDEGATPEVCDHKDNDCDGQTDEDTSTKLCGVGVCERAIPDCHPCEAKLGAQTEICDGLDNNCNGQTDEVAGTKPCGTGVCFREIPMCETCEPLLGAIDEVCDGLDNNCDGETDEVSGVVVCGLGACAHEVDGCEVCEPHAGAVEEICNLVDDDCDGATDEVSDLGVFVCGLGTCAHELPSCTEGTETECDGFSGASAEVCDGIDNDCDGVTDEDIEIWSCGVGACEHPVVGCVLEGAGACNPLLGASEEVCDGVDNDCNGETDEGLGTVVCGASLGCEAELVACDDGVSVSCNPINGLAPELCNGADDDCDGQTDEDQLEISCGLGSCFHSVPGCLGGVKNVCDPMAGATEEVCNFVDDDCDGETDEESPPVSCGEGVCATTVQGCLGGAPRPCKPLELGSPDVCNGLDDDCDGETDENLGELTCGQGACLKQVPTCVNGTPQACDAETGSAPEQCNGLDDDCDGDTDEELGTETCGVGACEHTVATCISGSANPCDPFLGLSPEVCDGKDNDCDGDTDDGLGELTCSDGAGGSFQTAACVGGAPAKCGDGPTTPEDLGASGGGHADASGPGGGGDLGPTVGAPAPGDGCQANPRGGSSPAPWFWAMAAAALIWWRSRPRRVGSRRRG